MKVRFWTNNVWADVFGNPVKGRDTALITLIRRYSPDVIMLQEMHPHWHESELKPALFGMGYVEAKPDLGGNTLNYTPIFYNGKRFNAVNECFHLYTGPNDYTSKSYTAVTLKEKETGRVFGAMSTHFWFEQSEKGNMARVMNASELTQQMVKMQNGTSMPVFAGGDFNCDISSDPYRFFEVNGINCSSLIADNKHNFIRTDHSNPVYNPEDGSYSGEASTDENKKSIDHIMLRGNAVVKDYTVVTDSEALIISDHCPVMIDAEI